MSINSLKMMDVHPRGVYLRFIILLGLTILTVLAVYTFLHEAGHALGGFS